MGDLITPDTPGLLAVAFLIGIVVGLTGMGGGALMTPALIFLVIPPTAAVANDLVAAAVSNRVANLRWRCVDMAAPEGQRGRVSLQQEW